MFFMLEVQDTKSAVIIEIEKVLNQNGLHTDIFNPKVSRNKVAYAIKIYRKQPVLFSESA